MKKEEILEKSRNEKGDEEKNLFLLKAEKADSLEC
nr:DUF6442 family protein [Paenibacillus odorifer]